MSWLDRIGGALRSIKNIFAQEKQRNKLGQLKSLQQIELERQEFVKKKEEEQRKKYLKDFGITVYPNENNPVSRQTTFEKPLLTHPKNQKGIFESEIEYKKRMNRMKYRNWD